MSVPSGRAGWPAAHAARADLAVTASAHTSTARVPRRREPDPLTTPLRIPSGPSRPGPQPLPPPSSHRQAPARVTEEATTGRHGEEATTGRHGEEATTGRHGEEATDAVTEQVPTVLGPGGVGSHRRRRAHAASRSRVVPTPTTLDGSDVPVRHRTGGTAGSRRRTRRPMAHRLLVGALSGASMVMAGAAVAVAVNGVGFSRLLPPVSEPSGPVSPTVATSPGDRVGGAASGTGAPAAGAAPVLPAGPGTGGPTAAGAPGTAGPAGSAAGPAVPGATVPGPARSSGAAGSGGSTGGRTGGGSSSPSSGSSGSGSSGSGSSGSGSSGSGSSGSGSSGSGSSGSGSSPSGSGSGSGSSDHGSGGGVNLPCVGGICVKLP